MRAQSFAVSLALLGCGHPRAPVTAPPAPPAATSHPSASSAEEPAASPTLLAPDAGQTRDEPVRGSVVVGAIASPSGFDPKPVIDSLKPELVACYDRARATTRALRGKLTLRIQVNEVGAVMATHAEPGGAANDPALVACLSAVLAGARFPEPGGTATILAPLVFRAEAVSR